VSRQVIDMRPEHQVADYLYRRVLTGASVNTFGHAPSDGFMVRYGAFPTVILTSGRHRHLRDEVFAYVASHWHSVAARGDAYFGIWFDQKSDTIYLDVSTEIIDRDAAIARGRKLGERAIYDVVRRQEVWVNA